MDHEKYLDMSDSDIDNLLLGIDLTHVKTDKTTNTCINCKSDNLMFETSKHQIICSICGVINNECLDEHPDMTLNEGESSSRYGSPSSYFFPKSSLGTKIVGNNRLSMIQRQGQMPYKEKSLMEVLDKIQYKCNVYGITQPIIDSAKFLYKKISESVHNKGKRKGKNIIMRCINRRSMIAACLFHACKLQKETRSPKEIADIYELNVKNVNKGCRKFCDLIDTNTLFNQIKCSQSADFIKRYSIKLGINNEYIDIIIDVANNISKLDIASTHEPPSIAAGCILLVVNYYNIIISKKNIAEIFGISDVTISKSYRKIYPYRNIILNNTITNLIHERITKLNYNREAEESSKEQNIFITSQ